MSDVTPIPYASPVRRPAFGQTFMRLLAVVIACGFVFAVLGGILGLLMGLAVPDYYRAVFRNDAINAPTMGGVMGIGQGAAIGVLAGLVLSLILTWREIRLAR